ncbi:LpqB family beta-propeller domain-containing protein [Microbacterium sp. SD291]|uniref:LpqB family beta-propeller domain-containing protein n=1 Tax=Microbacterium sp. SD291 TaxID=2782007 RepID=UPI001A95E24A|nr:LpqB family beta-propeller domain-containing protein [Microbacterium sp. SD291]MBO0980516.1 GerMN domain-containing protein [Microbacterium sp. SD291]
MTTRSERALRALALAAAALLLAACSGLPTSGDAQQGLALGESPEAPDFLLVASGPVDGAGPAAIVEGFMEAAITPADSWATARKFLTPEFDDWQPAAGVSVDVSSASRVVTASVEQEEEAAEEAAAEGDTAEVLVRIDQVASVDANGAYSEAFGASTLSFAVERIDGQWRISEAPDGVVIDESRFERVYESYALQYFDQAWKRLVPDVRWFPRRATGIATTITRSLIDGAPSVWLEPAVQTAFPRDVQLARDAVPIDQDQVADVALNTAAQSLDQTTLARMRTQLQSTLEAAGVNVNKVRFSVDGRSLDAGVVELVEEPSDAGSIVLADGVFGTVLGDEITPIPAVSEDLLSISQPIVAIDVAADDSFAALQLDDGHVYRAGDGRVDELDDRAGLIKPSIDPYGYTWSVPAGDPKALLAIGAEIAGQRIEGAWPEASSISAVRVAADGARVAAVVMVGAQRWVVVAAVIRDPSGLPTELGEVKPLTQLGGPASALVWLGPDRLAALVELDDTAVLTQTVGGIGATETAPTDAVSVAGSRTVMGLRVLGADGAVFARSGSAWRESTDGVLVLATRAGH